MDRARNVVARVVAQIRINHWRSAIFLKRIRKCEDKSLLVLWGAAGYDPLTRPPTLQQRTTG